MDKEIKDAIVVVKNCSLISIEGQDETVERLSRSLNTLISIAERYLEVGMPEKKKDKSSKEYQIDEDCCEFKRGYNKGLDDYRLWLAKRLADVGGILAQAYCTEEELLRKHLGGQDG